MWSQLAEWNEKRERFILATVTNTGGSTPRKLGAQMAITLTRQIGTIGGGAFEHWVIDEARHILSTPPHPSLILHQREVHLSHDLGMCCGGKMAVMLQDVVPKYELWIFGGGHIGEALAQISVLSDFDVHVVDDRPEWVDPSRFPPGVSLHCDDPELFVRETELSAQSLIVITTHSHAVDERLIELLAPGNFLYLGLIGSKAKWARFKQRLCNRVNDIELERVKCPMGLSINAQTPSEIAVSIIAELITVIRNPS